LVDANVYYIPFPALSWRWKAPSSIARTGPLDLAVLCTFPNDTAAPVRRRVNTAW